VLRGKEGGQVANLLIGMSVDEAVTLVRENIARVQAERREAAHSGTAPPVDASPADVSPVDAPPAEAPPVATKPDPEPRPASAASGGSFDLTSHVIASSVYLTAEERASVMWLAPRLPAARREELKAKLLQMPPRDAAMWIRENLAALRAEVSS
jgi:hypothetical protein